MNNILSFKSELVSKVIDFIFNHDSDLSNLTYLFRLSEACKGLDFFDKLEKAAEKVVGDFIITNYKLIKKDLPSLNNFMYVEDGRVVYSLQGLAAQVLDLLWKKHIG